MSHNQAVCFTNEAEILLISVLLSHFPSDLLGYQISQVAVIHFS